MKIMNSFRFENNDLFSKFNVNLLMAKKMNDVFYFEINFMLLETYDMSHIPILISTFDKLF